MQEKLRAITHISIYGVTKLEFAVCECGAKILIVPDLEKMRQAIDAHAAIHAKLVADTKKAEVERCRIETQLARKVIVSLIGMQATISIVSDDHVVQMDADRTF